MTRVLVCGGRNFTNSPAMNTLLGHLHDEYDFHVLIHGDAPGADKLAAAWAEHFGIDIEAYPAEWAKYGRSAGPRRNRQMLEEGKPDLVVALPGGRGTANMVMLAIEAGVELKDCRSLT